MAAFSYGLFGFIRDETPPVNDKRRSKKNEQAEPSDCDPGLTTGKRDGKERRLSRKRLALKQSSVNLIHCEATLPLGCSQPTAKHSRAVGANP